MGEPVMPLWLQAEAGQTIVLTIRWAVEHAQPILLGTEHDEDSELVVYAGVLGSTRMAGSLVCRSREELADRHHELRTWLERNCRRVQAQALEE